MTRPQIVRADTLDLQDKTSPTAADHSQHPHPAPLGTGPAAPHQEASLRRVDDERDEEGKALQNDLDDANGVHDDSDSDDERTAVRSGSEGDSAAVRLNGGVSGEADNAQMADTDADADVDDDLDDMDRISSSPSISDGGCSLPSYSGNWPEGRASLSPNSTPISSPNESAQECDSSSPYPETPIHFPFAPSAARRRHEVPAGAADSKPSHPFFSYPSSFHSSQNTHKIQSADHHHGEYTWPRRTHGSTKEATTNEQTTGQMRKVSPWTHHLTTVEQRLQERQESEMSLISELDEAAVRALLEPVPSPSLNKIADPISGDRRENRISSIVSSHDIETGEQTDTSSDEEQDDGSWTTDSDADSWDEDLDDDDDSNDVSFSKDSRFIDSGWGGICLQDIEDIDFEFVYALHTFVATVEGQANATKGDTMVLLDDSNSYWWLVRVVKDSSIGYLPAEHIETPTERLARLNKHRNIDLSATMLGDTADKAKNPLKKAMRRRAKGVTWGENTMVEASDYDYSSDEGGDDELFGGADPAQAQTQQQQADDETAEQGQDDGLKVQPLKVKNDVKAKGDAEAKDDTDIAINGDEQRKDSDDSLDGPLDVKVSRNGTLRNTDSFFKDDSTETRKISLTPNLLRDDSSTSTTGSRERGPSLESLEKDGIVDKAKDDKKKKEKKSGMLSGLFKRKDKKTKVGTDPTDSDAEKVSQEFGRSSPQSKRSEDNERPSLEQTAAPQRQLSRGKLHKSQRSREESPSKTKGILKAESPEPAVVQIPSTKEPASEKAAAVQAPSTMRLVAPEEDISKPSTQEATFPSENGSTATSVASKLNPINILKTQAKEPQPPKVKKAKQREQLDDFDSEEEDEKDPFADPDMHAQSAKPAEPEAPAGRLSESPVHVSVADAHPTGKANAPKKDQESDLQHPSGLTVDTSSQETNSPVSTPTPDDDSLAAQSSGSKSSHTASRSISSPSPVQQPLSSVPAPLRPAPVPQKEAETSPINSSESSSLPAWSDHSLRTYLDDGSDIRDMLLVINDTTGVFPVGSNHPIMAQLFVEETKTVSGLSNELDALLNGLLENRRKRNGQRGSSTTNSPVAINGGLPR